MPAAIDAALRVPPPAAFWWECAAFTKLAMVGVTMVGEVPNKSSPVPLAPVLVMPSKVTWPVAANVDENVAVVPLIGP
jgi:hypothetical protein